MPRRSRLADPEDVRDDDAVAAAVAKTVETLGGIDVCLNNASAIDLSKTPDIAMKRYDLMQDINCRGAFLLSKCCIPHLGEARTRTSSPFRRRST